MHAVCRYTQYHLQTHSSTNSLIQENVDEIKASQNEIKVTITEMERNQSQIKVSIGLLE